VHISDILRTFSDILRTFSDILRTFSDILRTLQFFAAFIIYAFTAYYTAFANHFQTAFNSIQYYSMPERQIEIVI